MELNLKTGWVGKQVIQYETTGSTNDDCFMLMEQGAKSGAVVIAKEQTSGKGRRGRSWESPKGGNIYLSIGLLPVFLPETASMITLVAALAVCRAIEDVTKDVKPAIKWPNDIVINGRKLCGILTELRLEKTEIKALVVGIGINMKKSIFSKEIADTAISLREVQGGDISKQCLIEALLIRFEEYYEKFVEKCNMSPILSEYEQRMINKDRDVCVLDPKGEYQGVALGIDEMGQLLVRKQDDTVEAVYAGEVSVRGIYGYV